MASPRLRGPAGAEIHLGPGSLHFLGHLQHLLAAGAVELLLATRRAEHRRDVLDDERQAIAFERHRGGAGAVLALPADGDTPCFSACAAAKPRSLPASTFARPAWRVGAAHRLG